jgi:hypothetical protein
MEDSRFPVTGLSSQSDLEKFQIMSGTFGNSSGTFGNLFRELLAIGFALGGCKIRTFRERSEADIPAALALGLIPVGRYRTILRSA